MKLAVVIGIPAVAVAAAVAWWLFGSDSDDGASAQAAAVLAAGLDRAMAAAQDLHEPYRCALWTGAGDGSGDTGDDSEDTGDDSAGEAERRAGRFVVRQRGNRLELATAPEPARARAPRKPRTLTTLTLGVVADAREDASAEHLAAVRRAFEDGGVDVVVSLGGLGRSQAEIAAVLEGLAGPWPLIAIPGDWEAVPAHRATTEALAGRGVVDGARVRLVRAGAITLATLPGTPHGERAMAGVDGCVYTDEDVVALAAALEAAPGGKAGARVVLSHAPPRQPEPGVRPKAAARATAQATDRVPEGIHIGEVALAQALERAGAEVSIHGLVAGLDRARGERGLARDGLVVLSAGALDGVGEVAHGGALPPLALLVSVEAPGRGRPGKVRWQAISRPGKSKTRPTRLE